jgi:hypothetical protein
LITQIIDAVESDVVYAKTKIARLTAHVSNTNSKL